MKDEDLLKFSSVKSYENSLKNIDKKYEELFKGIKKYLEMSKGKSHSLKLLTRNSKFRNSPIDYFYDKEDDLKEKLSDMEYGESDQGTKKGEKMYIDFINNSPRYMTEGLNRAKKNGGLFVEKNISASIHDEYFKPNGKRTKKAKKEKIKNKDDYSFKGKFEVDPVIHFPLLTEDDISQLHFRIVDEPHRYGIEYNKKEQLFEVTVKTLEKLMIQENNKAIIENKKRILQAIKEVQKD